MVVRAIDNLAEPTPTVQFEKATVGLPDIPSLDFALGPGWHALLGTPADGLHAIAPLVAGIVAPRKGRVRIAGVDPTYHPAIRARLGVTLENPLLPSNDTVGQLVQSLVRFRQDMVRAEGPPTELPLELTQGDPQVASSVASDCEPLVSAQDPLDLFGLGHWRRRTLASLSASERRSLELVFALTTPRPIALVLTEPGAHASHLTREAVCAGLKRIAAHGACIIVVTASVTDAVELANNVHMIERGRIIRSVSVADIGNLTPDRAVRMQVEVASPRPFLERLALEADVRGVDWDETACPCVITARGPDLERLALAIARTAAAVGAAVRSIVAVPPTLAEVNAATAGLELAAYHAAYAAYARYAESTAGAKAPDATAATTHADGEKAE